ncbi:MAG: SPOR domain-containing protein [Deltaproteobacteria bacterium]|nr:SPOR domain-containing protein [Deltaproteobacteria bacterium]
METRRGRRQLQFTGVEMTLLAVSFLVTASCVFFLGFYVGKKNAAAHVPRDERVARIPVGDFSKYSRPAAAGPEGSSTETGSAGADVPKGGARAKSDGKPPSGAAEAKTEAKEDDKTGDARGVAPAGEAKPDAAAGAADAKADGKDAKAADAKAAAAKAAADKAAQAKAAEAAKPEEDRKAGAGGYTVQVLATRKQGDAEALVKKLASRGYGAYIKRVSDGQTSWYRVRVGRYGVFGEARTMADHCRRELGLEQAFVSTE